MQLYRREFLRATTAGAAMLAWQAASSSAAEAVKGGSANAAELNAWLKQLDGSEPYFTPAAAHGKISCKLQPAPWTLSGAQVGAARLDEASWSLEIPASGPGVRRPRTVAAGNPITFAELDALMRKNPVKVLKCLTDTLANTPQGHGLWEGVAVRDVLALVELGDGRNEYFRRFNFVGDDKSICGSVTLSRIFEDPPGMAPVILALRYNGAPIPLSMGGPVRLIVPEGYADKCVGFLRQIVPHKPTVPPDAASRDGIDPESPFKTCAVKLYSPQDGTRHASGAPLVVAGLAQVGGSGLAKAQIAVVPADTKVAADDPWLNRLPWSEAELVAAPDMFGAEIPGGLKGAVGVDPVNGRPTQWPLPNFVCRFAAVVRDLRPGKYRVYFRTVDGHGFAQPMPRPFEKSGVADQVLRPVLFEVT